MVFLTFSLGALASSAESLTSCLVDGVRRCGEEKLTANCGCDSNCLERNDCCHDYSSVCVGACEANTVDKFLCRDGTECDPMTHPDTWGCCTAHGGKLKCPSSIPYMCTGVNGGINWPVDCGGDHCCFEKPQLCSSYHMDRSLLQDCPAAIGSERSICAYNQGPFQLWPGYTHLMGSSVFRYELKDAASFTISEDGSLSPPKTWDHCPASNEATTLVCKDGKECDAKDEGGWDCCVAGRLKCPAEAPVMCNAFECGMDKKQPCCAGSVYWCGEAGPLKECPVEEEALSGNNDTRRLQEETTSDPVEATPDAVVEEEEELPITDAVVEEEEESPIEDTGFNAIAPIRQCSANTPVLCTDNTCVATKGECTVQTNCPQVPHCAADDEFESTPIGHTAYAPCGEGRVGRKFRLCFGVNHGADQEVAEWSEVVDDETTCRAAVQKCANIASENGDVIPYMPVGAVFYLKKTDCPSGSGMTVYRCVLDGETPKHEIEPLCDIQCDRESCGGRGEGFQSSISTCECSCDAGYTGAKCESVITPVATPSNGGKKPEPPQKRKEGKRDYTLHNAMVVVAGLLTGLFIALLALLVVQRRSNYEMADANVLAENDEV